MYNHIHCCINNIYNGIIYKKVVKLLISEREKKIALKGLPFLTTFFTGILN